MLKERLALFIPLFMFRSNSYQFTLTLQYILISGELVLPDILQEAQVDVMPNDDCNDLYGGSIQDSMICVGVPGESGGCFVSSD